MNEPEFTPLNDITADLCDTAYRLARAHGAEHKTDLHHVNIRLLKQHIACMRPGSERHHRALRTIANLTAQI